MTDQRVQCPKCGLRVRVPPERVPDDKVLAARCRQCRASFDVRKLHGRVVVDVTAAPVVSAENTVAPAPRTSIRPGDVPDRLPGGFQVGDRLGRYEIEGLAGRGGMGTVYRAFDPSANRHVALKVLRRDATDLDRVRFEREIAVQANIRHPHIMPILDSGSVGSTRFYAMELLHDPVDLLHLAERVQFRRTDDTRLRSISTLLGVLENVMLPICKAAQHANEEGVLHRDIKPINVMVDRRNLRPYLIDFGVSSLLEPHNPRMAHIDESFPVPLRGKGVHVTGTLMFMPPEQARGKADRRGDVWALGALLHFLVTGGPPFEEAVRPVIPREERIQNIRLLVDEARAAGNDDEVHEYQEMLDAIEGGTERTVEELRRDVLRGHYLARPLGLDARLDAIIAKAMHAAPDKRFEHAGVLHDALHDWLQDQAEPPPTSRDAKIEGGGHRPLWQQPAVLAIAGLLVGGAATAVFWPRDAGPDLAGLAAGHMARAQQLEANGELAAAQQAVRDALDARTSDAALAMWDRLAVRQQIPDEVARVRELLSHARKSGLTPRERDRLLGAVTERVNWLESVEGRVHALSDAELRALGSVAQLKRPVEVAGAPEGTSLTLVPWTHREGALWPQARPVATTFEAEPGHYVLWLQRSGRDVYLPIEIQDDAGAQAVSCPVDPARVPPGLVYIGGGAFTGMDGRSYTVPTLLWEKQEVTMARYAEFLETLTPQQRRARVPRLEGDLGASGGPLWKSSGERFLAPSGALRKPVEHISQYDAKAFAAFVGRRLPTEAEWTWAAAGPFAPATPLGDFATLSGRARLTDKVAGVAETKTDRNVFGLFDMAGNIAEFTSTLVRDDDSGWVVKGGSYVSQPSAALVYARRLVPGWIPQEGVGIRLVADLSALGQEEAVSAKEEEKK